MKTHPLKKYREKYELSQARLAKLLSQKGIKISASSICRWEHDKHPMKRCMAIHIESVLGIPKDQLMFPTFTG